YMAAVLSRNRSDITKLTGFMDECKAMKIPVKGPDVNESFNDFGVNKQGDIRFGLAAIKGVGDNVVSAIIRTRQEGGRFESPYDFVERVPANVMNRRVFESLVLAGAFDWYTDLRREDYFVTNNRDESFVEELLRFGAALQRAADEAQNSLFGDMMDEMNREARPHPARPAERWPDTVRLDKEKELVGMYLSAHPLDNYYMEVKYGMTAIQDLLDMEPEDGKEVTFGGLVSKFEKKQSRNGNEYARMTIEDYSGTYDVVLFGQKCYDYSKYGDVGTPVMVTGRFEKRFNRMNNSEEISFTTGLISLLADVKGKLVTGVTIDLSPEDIKSDLPSLLSEHAASSTEARGSMSFRVYDPVAMRYLKLTSSLGFPLDRNLVDLLTDLDIAHTFEVNHSVKPKLEPPQRRFGAPRAKTA
ncbi:MAG: DNA polymerase III subunit alpha, partial [Muribaculaceae bacterium]|nr:DNA polymerase III subunit alpha [Muribaculaceae bacterium]